MSKKELNQLKIKDTYPDFLSYWRKVGNLSTEQKLKKWRSKYIANYPSLLNKQLEDYESQGFDWRQEAKNKVFPHLEERLPAMTRAKGNLREIIPVIYKKAYDFFDFNLEVTAVIYVGIGCGAGWATEFKGKPALLFGLENIAECRWSDSKSIEGLVAHELGHLFHDRIRQSSNLPMKDGPFWRLYKEGVAKWSESELLNRESWYESRGLNESGWLDWCREHRGWLAKEFLRRVEKEKSVEQFFGSWYDLKGWKQTGYFLGYEATTSLISSFNLPGLDILNISDPPEHIKQTLETIAKRS